MVKGIDQLRPSLGVKVQKPNLPTQNQFLLASQQQQVLAQAQAQSNLGSSTKYQGHTSGRLAFTFTTFTKQTHKMKMGHMQHSSSLQPDQLQQQQLRQGGMAQVRFQPRIGNLVVAASDKVVSIFDIETDRQTYSFQSLELWNMAENTRMPNPAHENIISALARSPVTGTVVSASHDNSVKLWK